MPGSRLDEARDGRGALGGRAERAVPVDQLVEGLAVLRSRYQRAPLRLFTRAGDGGVEHDAGAERPALAARLPVGAGPGQPPAEPLRRHEVREPAVSEAAGPDQRRLRAPADPDRRMGSLHRPELERGPAEAHELALEARHLLGPEGPDGAQRLVGPPTTLAERDAAGLVFLRELAADAHSEHGAPRRELIEGGERLGDYRGGTERQQEHSRSQRDPAGPRGQGPERDERIEDRAMPQHVIADPDDVEPQPLELLGPVRSPGTGGPPPKEPSEAPNVRRLTLAVGSGVV